VIVAVADIVVSALEVALSVTLEPGTLAGAPYVTGFAVALGDRLPQAPVQLRLQVTPLFCESLVTVAVKLCVVPTCTLWLPGATLTPITGGGGGALDPPFEQPSKPIHREAQ